MTVSKQVDKMKLSKDLTWSLQQNKYENVKVEVEQELEKSVITLKTNIKEDEKVKDLSLLLKNFLIDDGYIASADDILDLAITGPSIGANMQSSALRALII